jgi:hypothetical protein
MTEQSNSRPSNQFTPKARDITPGSGDQLDSSGQAILSLLHTAAGEAETVSRQALEKAQRLSRQLQAAQDRIAELEAEVRLYREKDCARRRMAEQDFNRDRGSSYWRA